MCSPPGAPSGSGMTRGHVPEVVGWRSACGSPLGISAQGGGFRSPPLCLLILLRGKDPLTWVQASGLCLFSS